MADSWFGSLKTAKALLSKGLYCIMNIKNGHKGFPKSRLKEAVIARGQQAHMKLTTVINGETR